jgi:NAD+ diphosphatase
MYCKECGQKLSLRFCENEGLIPYCGQCEAYMFPQFPVAVSMVVTNRAQDKILLAKHVEDEDFILFAGYIKKGENAEKTVPREIKEELGLNVVKAKYMSSRYYEKNDVLMLNFIVIVEDKEIKINADEIAEYVGKKSGIGVKVTNFGHIQRGGSPNMMDRVLAARFGYKAVELLRDDCESCAIGIKDNKVITVPFEEVSKAEKKFDKRLYDIAHVLSL